MRDEILYGDCLERLREIPDESVHMCVTSPPYWGLRDYQTRRWFDGDPRCDHDMAIEHGPHHPGQVEQTKWKNAEAAGKGQTATTHECSKCGSWYGQLGLEPTPDLYVAHMVQVFREVRRTLREDGTLWLNIGDSYASASETPGRTKRRTGLKAKDLIGVPWKVAFALQADGWYLRSDIVWNKPNCLPESVIDRPTRAHEYVFLLSKSDRYYFDYEAVKEQAANGETAEPTRRLRTVWSINTRAYKGAHFAVFPPELPRRCILAGSPEGGVVLDPFAGSGTTLAEAVHLDRGYIGIEVNSEYKPLIERRLQEAEDDASQRALYAIAFADPV